MTWRGPTARKSTLIAYPERHPLGHRADPVGLRALLIALVWLGLTLGLVWVVGH
jgi:hypothetical protein